MRIGLLNINQGNLYSIKCALDKISKNVIFVEKKEDFIDVDVLILPGVGAYNTYMKSIKLKKLYNPILEFFNNKKKIIGICVGMQVLFENGEENEKTQGFGIFKGICSKNDKGLNVGYMKLEVGENKNSFFNSFKNKKQFFTHAFSMKKSFLFNDCMSVNINGIEIIAAIKEKNTYGVQFHPELSGDIGIKLLKKIIYE